MMSRQHFRLNGLVECGVRFGVCIQRSTHSLEVESCTGGIEGTGVMPWRALSTWIQFVPGGFEAFRCDVWFKVHKNPPRRELCTHTHGPACNIRGSPDRQQWLSGASSSQLKKNRIVVETLTFTLLYFTLLALQPNRQSAHM